MNFYRIAVLTDSLVSRQRIIIITWWRIQNFSENWLFLIFLRTTPVTQISQKEKSCLKRKRIISRTIYEFIVLGEKFYAYNIINITVRGIRGHVVKNHLTFNNHKACLLETDDEEETEQRKRVQVSARSVTEIIHKNIKDNSSPFVLLSYIPYTRFRVNVSLESIEHKLRTVKTVKRALIRFDDKVLCVVIVDKLSHSHYTQDKKRFKKYSDFMYVKNLQAHCVYKINYNNGKRIYSFHNRQTRRRTILVIYIGFSSFSFLHLLVGDLNTHNTHITTLCIGNNSCVCVRCFHEKWRNVLLKYFVSY